MQTHPSLSIADHLQSLRLILQPWRAAGEKIAFVPTMGALHDGHLSLIRLAKAKKARVVVSIFVNPRQFAPNEDFATYPRTEEEDIAKIAEAGGDLAYLPSADLMYPQGYQTVVSVPRLAEPLDGASRPGFFDGIATVVTKLFNQVRPNIAIFGEKDFQQLLVIRQMVADLNLDIEVVGAPIVREADGLAMSSRNQYLSPEERATAGHLNRVMKEALEGLKAGGDVADVLEQARTNMEAAGLAPIDYLELRRLPDLTPLTKGVLSKEDQGQARLFAAVMLGRTRLIDNMGI